MNKAIVIKSIVLIAVLALIHSVFWFFKAGQIEKHVNNFITENSAHVSAGEVAVSGFPLSQKVSIQDLKFIVPNSALSRYQATVKKLEAKASIFSNNFCNLQTIWQSFYCKFGKYFGNYFFGWFKYVSIYFTIFAQS